MQKHLLKSDIKSGQSITITGSKSETNRALLLKAFYPSITIENVSNSDDSQLMQKAFSKNENIIDIHHAGTAMRFLTAYFAIQEGEEVVLTGSSRMKERPIKILVEALQSLGAKISYLENEGCPPLKIIGQKITEQSISIKANVSSQYISALLLIAPMLENGLELKLKGEITSIPYINMTLSLLNQIGVKTEFRGDIINIEPFNPANIKNSTLTIESDWSSVSYFYSIIALSPVRTTLELSYFKENSLQGDSVLAQIYEKFGVETQFSKDTLRLIKVLTKDDNFNIVLDLTKSPDIAQTIAVTCFGLGIKCRLLGLHTLKIKETDRLVALKTELEKLGAEINITNNSLELNIAKEVIKGVQVETYNDHRMAMAFAPLALKTPITINDYNVVSKSYPDFWEHIEQIGIKSQE